MTAKAHLDVPRVSIIIRCYNEERHIGRLLAGILAQTVEDYEIIVVDSGSTDATLSIASRFPVRIEHIASEAFSFGRALNMGCSVARGKYLVFASAHVYPVYRDWLEQLLAPFADPRVVLSYGKQRGDHRTKFSERQVFARWFPEQSTLDQSHPFCNNANAAIRRERWEQEPYDEDLTGLEDLDWARRVKEKGYKIAYVAEAEVKHVHEETWARIFNRYRREATAFKQIFPEEHFTFWDFVRLYVANIVADYRHAWQDGVWSRHWRSVPMFRLMQFWGTYRGFRQHGPVTSALHKKYYYPNGERQQEASSLEKREWIDYAAISEELDMADKF